MEFSARSNTMKKNLERHNNIRQATAHRPIEMFFKFIVVLFNGDIARSRRTFLTMINNLKFTKINSGINNAMRIAKKTEPRITFIPLPEIIYMAVVMMSNIARKVSRVDYPPPPIQRKFPAK